MRILALALLLALILIPTMAVGQDTLAASDSIYVVADEMPYLPDCYADSLSNKALSDCSKDMLLEGFFSLLQFPKQAIKKKKGGMAVVSFIINKDGTMSDLQVIKDPGYGMGESALATLELLKSVIWEPAEDDGQAVRFRYMLPVRFQFG